MILNIVRFIVAVHLGFVLCICAVVAVTVMPQWCHRVYFIPLIIINLINISFKPTLRIHPRCLLWVLVNSLT